MNGLRNKELIWKEELSSYVVVIFFLAPWNEELE